MKPFKFTLQRLLDYKETLLDKEKNTLAAFRAEQRRVQDEIDYVDAQRRTVGAEIRRVSAEGALAFEIQNLQFQVDISTNILEELYVEKRKIDTQVEKQLKIVLDIIRENKQMEKLKEKQLEEYHIEENRKNEETISEFISGNLIREKQAG